jgi:hypothetical protein
MFSCQEISPAQEKARVSRGESSAGCQKREIISRTNPGRASTASTHPHQYCTFIEERPDIEKQLLFIFSIIGSIIVQEARS